MPRKGFDLRAFTRPWGEMFDEMHAEATRNMIEQAQRLGADAIIAVRYVTDAWYGVLAYGTAVTTA